MTTSGRSGRVETLGPLVTFRFFAAMAIVVFHTLAQKDEYLRSGVTFFYVLSGFILTYVHPRLVGALEYLRFWVARIARIWPLHLFTFVLVVFMPFGPLLQKHLWLGTLLNVSLLQAWVPVGRVALSYNGVSWSLSVELLFYLLFPFLLPLVSKMPLRMVLATVLLTLSLSLGVAALGLPDIPKGNSASYETFVLFFPLMHLYKFVTGMAIGVWWLASDAKTITSKGNWLGIELFGFAGMLCMLPGSDIVASIFIPSNMGYMAERQLQDFLTVPVFGLLLFIFAYQAGPLSSLLSQKWLIFLGEASFSTYMLQGLIRDFISRLNISVLSPGGWCVYAMALLFFSAISYKFLEKPARRYFIRLSEGLLKRTSWTRPALSVSPQT